MNLIQNESRHWQIAGGAELYSGDQVELYQNGRWVRGEIQYRPGKNYLVRLENGQFLDLNEQLTLRYRSSIEMANGKQRFEKALQQLESFPVKIAVDAPHGCL